MDIDFVITWVDMNDPEWLEEFSRYRYDKHNTRNGVSEARFRDNGFLRYWFRGVEKFAPWVRKIHFIVNGRTPEWLDTSNPKLHIVRHADFIPAEFLPTFNSVVIERYMHHIPGLSDHFVYFNDDFYIINLRDAAAAYIPMSVRHRDNTFDRNYHGGGGYRREGTTYGKTTLRTGPGSRYPEMGTLKAGATVMVYDVIDDWYMVVDSQTGEWAFLEPGSLNVQL